MYRYSSFYCHFVLRMISGFQRIGLFGIILTIALSCNKSDNPTEVPNVSTKNPGIVTESTAEVGGFVTSDGGGTVTEKGVCYAFHPNPTILDMTVGVGYGTGNFQHTLTGLYPDTTYYLRAYALNEIGIGYGNEITFMTKQSSGLPSVSTDAISTITPSSAICGGDITKSGSTAVTARGVCWSKLQNPTLSDSHTSDGTGTGSFVSSIAGLDSNTVYYVRAYATNSLGTAYGAQVSFITNGSGGTIPMVTTSGVTGITEISAISGGNVISQGSSAVTQRGVCWSLSKFPSISDDITTDGSGLGSFTSQITGLSSNTRYYVRAYAINESGTGYGDTVSFNTTNTGPQVCPPTVSYGGKTYNTIDINGKCWFKENLNVGQRIDGELSQSPGNSVVEKYCYDNLEINCEIYGGLYQWDELMQGSINPGDRGLCPEGWHVPTDQEWIEMADFLGGDSIAGGALKKAGITFWKSPNTGATNSSGFTALPGGSIGTDHKFSNLTFSALIWTSTQSEATTAWHRSLYYSSVQLGRYSSQKIVGYSARCLKN